MSKLREKSITSRFSAAKLILVGLCLASTLQAEEHSTLVLIIDPAHGGKDRGVQDTLYGEKTSEAAVTLRFAKEMAKVAQASFSDRLQVKLTRQDDYTVEHGFRAGFANEQNAAAAIALHFARSQNPLKRGMTIYYRPPGDPQPNSASTRWQPVNQPDPAVLEQSRALANQLRDRISPNQPVRLIEADLQDFIGLRMPALVIEIGYFSNSLDREVLKREESRTKLITALLQAIVDFQWKKPT